MINLDVVARANGAYVDDLYRRYLQDPKAVDPEWAVFFAGFEMGLGARGTGNGNGGARLAGPAAARAAEGEDVGAGSRVAGIYDLVHSFRELGHYVARLDPLGNNQDHHPLLSEVVRRFSEADLSCVIEGAGGLKGVERATVREMIERLRATYCGTLGVQYLQIPDKTQREWLQERMEPTLNRASLTREERVQVLREITAAEEFEQFLHAKFVGQKRFSLEGAESLIPILETVIEEAADGGGRELIMGMAHRGRLNVLAHTLRKPLEVILAEFEGVFLPDDVPGDGDVKYHLGFSHDHKTRGQKDIHLSLCPNPSHLEHVNPIATGIVRAKQDRVGDADRNKIVSLLIHGDAAFTGQGLVYETLALSELAAYETGGTIHVILDNRIGFTALPKDYRFTPYASDPARLIYAPIFHINGDDPEAAVQAARLATQFAQRFKKDVVLNLICYRRHGHNEIDDPTFTAPVLYKKIAQHPTTRRVYESRLVQERALDQDGVAKIAGEARRRLEDALETARKKRPKQVILTLGGAWAGLARAGKDWTADTRVARETLERITRSCAKMPEGFTPHPKIRRLLDQRVAMMGPNGRLDFATAEMLAFGSLALEGTRVRLAGQDAGRGTFSHRHAALYDFENGARYVPLDNVDPKQARFTVIDSMLSEAAVLGFECGHSWADPWTLVLWEAQFGDFANVAQAIVNVFLVAGESKWQRMSGMVLLLPHGYEGQGPEHSSARLERFLQLSAEDNIQVANLSTPAQYFHALRRQMRRKFRKPLIIMTPKSLLRHELATSTLDELAQGTFRTVLDDPAPLDRAKVRRVILCSGKIYYALLRAREERGARDVTLVRVEQLHPFPGDEIAGILGKVPPKAEVIWCQEEPQNMGSWAFVALRLPPKVLQGRELRYVGRDEAASPATGSAKIHQVEEDALVNEALS